MTFTGSLIAAGKLQGIKWVKKLTMPGKGVWNILFIVLTIVSFVILCIQPEQRLLWSILTTVFALCYGLVFVIPIGGATCPSSSPCSTPALVRPWPCPVWRLTMSP